MDDVVGEEVIIEEAQVKPITRFVVPLYIGIKARLSALIVMITDLNEPIVGNYRVYGGDLDTNLDREYTFQTHIFTLCLGCKKFSLR